MDISVQEGKVHEVNPICEAPTRETRPEGHREFHPLLFSYFIQKDKTLLLIVIFFLTVVNLFGDFHISDVGRMWGVIEMHWLNYSVPKSLLNEIFQKYQEYTHVKSWKVLFSNLTPKDTASHLQQGLLLDSIN